MNDSEPTNQQPAQDPTRTGGSPFSVAALLRCAADEELTPQQRADLDAHLAAHPADAARIRFECELRGACARVMTSGAGAPPALRALIVAKISAHATPGPAPEPEVVVVGRIGPSFLQRFGFAAAAVLVAAVGVGLLVRGGMLAQQAEAQANPAVVLTTFLSDEHQKCSSSDSLLSHKLQVTDASRVPGAVQQILGKPVSIESMCEAGFEFVGAGSCAVPDAEKSVHLMFRRPNKADGRPGTPVSLFIEHDTGRLNLEEGVTYSVEEGGRTSARVIAWTSDGLVYYLVTRCSVSCDAAKSGLAAPSCVAGLAR